MKRSRVIKKMQDCYDTCKFMGYNDNIAFDRVLEICEELGMLPPLNPQYDLSDIKHEVHSWEPEYDHEFECLPGFEMHPDGVKEL